MVPKLGVTKCGRRARAAVISSSTVISVMLFLPWLASNQAKNSHSAAPSCSMLRRTLSASTAFLRDFSSCDRSEEHTSELQSLMRNSYAVFCLKKKNTHKHHAHSKHN